MVKVWYICDEGLAISMETGDKANKVANMQSAIKFLVKSKDVMAANVKDIEIYSLGVTKVDYENNSPLKPTDEIPKGSTQKNAIFVHVPREKQQLTPEERRLYANPKPKQMARPQIEKLVINPKKKKPKPKKAEPEQVEVTVRCAHDGKEFKAVIDPKHRIADLKNQFGYESGVPAPNQILKKEGNELQDAKTAADSGIKNGDVLDLERKPITVHVRPPDGKMIPVTMKLSDNTEYIKGKVAPECGIEVPRQILKYNGTEMENGKTAKDMGLQDGSILDVEPRTIRVQVRTPDGKRIPVEMKKTDKILFIKEKVAPQTGIAVPRQLLKYKDKELPDEKSADECGLKDGSIIDLKFPTITVKVKTPNGKIIPVTMEPCDKIRFIKEKVAPQSGIEVEDQTLKFKNTELPNNKSADDMGLKDGDIIDLHGPTITVKVKTPDDKIIPVTMEPSDKIRFIKEKVAPKSGIEVEDQTLTFNDTELPNNKSADDMGLEHGDIIDLHGPKEESDDDVPVEKPKEYGHDFEGTPFDLTRFRAWFMVADTVPFEMICPIAMTIKEFKEEILKLRNDAKFVKKYFEGLEDPNELKIYPAGSWGEGDPLPEDIPVPKDSSEYAFFSVTR